MKFRKISLDDLEILQKHRVQTRNFYVSSHVEIFTCGAIMHVLSGKEQKSNSFGISKEELKISNRVLVCRYLGGINGGS